MSYPQADIYDAFATDDWTTMGPVLAAALEPWRGTTGVALDLGAGTGLSTAVVAEQLPAAEVLSCEPNPTLRASLITRVVERGLIDRVSVYPFAAADVISALDEPITVMTALNMIGHVAPVAAHAPTVADPEPVTFVERRIGRRTYTGECQAEVDRDGKVVWRKAWRVREGGELVDERTARIPWSRVDQASLGATLSPLGLAVELAGDLLLVTRAGETRAYVTPTEGPLDPTR
ncbi:hypothetical protein GCM10022199_25850 [Marihabitans asiaticum]|uniref:Methyltransferase family protein n=1 Tax=Marihabitans asiaticum TaxID=415218 RepID=A0A560WGT6_9MICO|nr:class I SAM-dependent methyltransferase [Marihabitans asiaticum]TWD16770.1 hypothetical protein FB557_0307 [Marihabitans asiaticum]